MSRGQQSKQDKLSIFDTFFPTKQQSKGLYSQAKKAISSLQKLFFKLSACHPQHLSAHDATHFHPRHAAPTTNALKETVSCAGVHAALCLHHRHKHFYGILAVKT